MTDFVSRLMTNEAPVIIAVTTPLIIQGVKKTWKQVPREMLPILAPIVGVLLDQVLAYITSTNGAGTVTALLAGSAGVGIRELVTKTKQAVMGA